MRNPIRPVVLLICIVALTNVLQGCSSVSNLTKRLNPFYTANALQSLQVVSQEDANFGYAVAMDIVFIEDEQKAKTIGQLTASQWFNSKKREFSSECPGEVCIKHIELMPSDVKTISLPEKHRLAKSVLVFVWYLQEPKLNRFDISTFEHARVTLQYSTIRVEKVQ